MGAPRLEQRVFLRLTVELPVAYRVVLAAGSVGEFAAGQVLNLSSGGMLLRAPEIPMAAAPRLLAGEGRIEVRFELGDEGPALQLVSRLIWLQGPNQSEPSCQFGLMFLDVAPATRERLHAFVSAQAR
ncbi:MAG: PilZ domain-containing protein [Phycisphaerales bacterium]|nr:PilZ domain-containing protein [Phycisphaerales bacterium]